ncbi:hypothetical protein [Specibacter cremeus]|uniref:hypothetical protein n=1 Tax=Specibacter cremeus TaxID=1629051 RepID=UPI000F76BA76|nr:hypothetical protein [Specibacter cremeus]
MAQEQWLGEPIQIANPTDIAGVERLRRVVFGGGPDEPLKHLGESQTCYLLLNDAQWAGSEWVTDDGDALDYARFKGITTRETIDIIKSVIADGDLTADQGFDLMRQMTQVHGRSLRMPERAAELLR